MSHPQSRKGGESADTLANSSRLCLHTTPPHSINYSQLSCQTPPKNYQQWPMPPIALPHSAKNGSTDCGIVPKCLCPFNGLPGNRPLSLTRFCIASRQREDSHRLDRPDDFLYPLSPCLLPVRSTTSIVSCHGRCNVPPTFWPIH